MELERLLSDPRMMQAVLGMSREEFALLVPVLDQVWQQVLAERPNRQRAVGAGAKGKLAGAARKLGFILFYLKVYPTFDVLSFLFALDRSEGCRWGHKTLARAGTGVGAATGVAQTQNHFPSRIHRRFSRRDRSAGGRHGTTHPTA